MVEAFLATYIFILVFFFLNTIMYIKFFFLFFFLLQYSYGAGFCKKIHIIYSYLSLFSHKPIQHCIFLSFFIFNFPLLSYALLESLNWLPDTTYYILKLWVLQSMRLFFGKLNKVATESGRSSTELRLLLHIHTCCSICFDGKHGVKINFCIF